MVEFHGTEDLSFLRKEGATGEDKSVRRRTVSDDANEGRENNEC
jgi:hypothetical protein